MHDLTAYQTPQGFDGKSDGVAYGELTELSYHSSTTRAARKCYVYTPPGYDPQETYPILYLLHGIGGIHTEWLNGAPNEIISNLLSRGEAKPMIVVMPNIRAANDDSVPQAVITPESIAACDNFINDLRDNLMPFISKHYNAASNRESCAVAGLSMGGREALYIGIKMPQTFGYIGAFSPAPGLIPMSHPNDRPHKGQLTAEEMTLPDSYMKNTFILMCSGTEEEMFNHIAAAYQQAFDANGVQYEYYLTEGGHDFRTWKNGLYHFARKIF